MVQVFDCQRDKRKNISWKQGFYCPTRYECFAWWLKWIEWNHSWSVPFESCIQLCFTKITLRPWSLHLFFHFFILSLIHPLVRLLLHSFVRTFIQSFIHACYFRFINTYIQTPVLHAYMHACIRTYIHTYTHTCIHVYIGTEVGTFIHTYIRTGIHPYIQWSHWNVLIGRFAPLHQCATREKNVFNYV